MIRTSLRQAQHFVLHKNHLTANPAADLPTLAATLGGLPLEPPAASFLAAFIRSADFAATRLQTACQQEQSLIAAPTVRSAPHLLPTGQYPRWFAATARQRSHSLNANLRLWGLETNEPIEQLAVHALAVTDREPLTIESIASRLSPDQVKPLRQTSRGGRVTTTTTAALAVQWLVQHGDLVQTNPTENWGAAPPRYARLTTWVPHLNLSDAPAEADAQKAVVRTYLAAFGPATEADISFWTGFGKSETARATGALAAETTLTMVEGIPGMLLLLKEQADALRSLALPTEPVISVLPANDPFTVAHRASRSRYAADPKVQRQIFSSSGSAKPAILIDGHLAGLWAWSAANETPQLEWQLFAPVETAVAARIEAELHRVAAFMSPQTALLRRDELSR